jgi:two-component system copper resistance phosphate regulon response regulator CusR
MSPMVKNILKVSFSTEFILTVMWCHMRILIIEDELKTAEYIKKGLTGSGYIVDLAHNGEDGLFMASHGGYDLIVLDVMLPKLDGFSVGSMLRSINRSVHIIYLTARDDIDDKVRGLELGADDYIVKPFSFSELLARVRSCLRRNTPQNELHLKVCDLVIDVVKRKVNRDGKRIDLSPKEYSLLYLMVQRQGEILSRTFIAEAVWDVNFDSDKNVIDVAVRILSQTIDDDHPVKLIHTIRGMGYVLEDKCQE